MGKCHVEGCNIRPALNECYDEIDERYYDICDIHKKKVDDGKKLRWKSGSKKRISLLYQRLAEQSN